MTDLSLTRGDYFSFDVTISDVPEGEEVTSVVFAAKRRTDDAEAVIRHTLEDTYIALDESGDAPVATVLIRPADTQYLTYDERRLMWEVQVGLTSTAPYTIDRGALLISMDVAA